MAGIKFVSTGSYTPQNVLTNAMLEQAMDTSDEWIKARTWIEERKIAGPSDTNLSMSLAACKKALSNSSLELSDIGLVVVATLTHEFVTPSLSCLLHRELGLAQSVLAIDVNCACSGFIYALKTAHALLADLNGKAALVVGCEMLSKITDYRDRATCILFGDGAGCAIIQRTESGGFYFDGGTIGSEENLFCKAQYIGNSPFFDQGAIREPHGLYMNGQEIFRFALEVAPKSIASALAQASLALEDIDHFVFHQANGRIIEGVAKRMKLPLHKCFVNIQHTGNTSCASVALALDALNDSGALKRGDNVVLVAFGGGLAYASACFRW